jgi:hypothetical protein
VIGAEFPDPILLDCFVLVDRRAHRRTATEAQLLHHANADLRGLAIAGDVNDGLHLHVIAETAGDRAFLPAAEHRQQEFADARVAFVDAALGQLDPAVAREQVGEIVPEVLVEIVAVGARQIVELVEVFHATHGVFSSGQRRLHIGRFGQASALRIRHQRRGGELFTGAADFGVVRRFAGDRIAIVERRDVRFRIDGVRLRRRLVGRQLRACGRRGLRVLGPPFVVVGDERRIEMQRLEFPDAILFDEAVLVRAFAPSTGALIFAGHCELAAADASGHAVGRDVDDGLELDVVVQHAVSGALRAEQLQECAHARLAGVDALLGPLDGAVSGEQIGDLIPHVAVEVVAVDALEILDVLRIPQQRGALREVGCTLARVAATAFDLGNQRIGIPDRAAGGRAGICIVKRSDACGGEAIAFHVPLAIRRMRQLAPRASAARCASGGGAGRCTDI